MKTNAIYSLFNRQKVLVSLLHAFGRRVRNLDFQKLLFLYCQEVEAAPSYEFIPCRFGGFSFTTYANRRKLIERGLLMDENDAWELTAAGNEVARGLETNLKE